MDLKFFKRNKKGKEDNKHSERTTIDIKCKHCEMSFENKERLKIHSRIAHTGRGERKKNDYGH
jgi:hypothetical protein